MTYLPYEHHYIQSEPSHDQIVHEISLIKDEYILRLKELDIWKERVNNADIILYPLTPDSISRWSQINQNFFSIELQCNRLAIELLILEGYFDPIIEQYIKEEF